MYCINIDCNNPIENYETGLCASCSHQRRKEARNWYPKKPKPIKKVSPKRAKQLEIYGKKRVIWLAEHDKCEVAFCRHKSTEVHHQKGREGELLLDDRFWLAVCHEHHRKITDDSKWALDNYYSYPRNKINQP